MLISLTTFLATLSSIFRSRAALQLENLALRHQIGMLLHQGIVHRKVKAVRSQVSPPPTFRCGVVASDVPVRDPVLASSAGILWFAKMISDAKSLRISDIHIDVRAWEGKACNIVLFCGQRRFSVGTIGRTEFSVGTGPEQSGEMSLMSIPKASPIRNPAAARMSASGEVQKMRRVIGRPKKVEATFMIDFRWPDDQTLATTQSWGG